MSRVFNFSAGPATLPEEVLEQARDELLEWNGAGTSVMEMSHRGKEFISIADKAEADLREVMAIPSDYKVLFLQGGASSQFAMVPQNLLGDKTKADYVLTGHWSKKAIKEAQRFCQVNTVADSEASKFTTIPDQDQWQMAPNAAYLHYTPNETIAGVEFSWIPQTGDVPLVADMSSTILSRPIDVSRYGIIYAGAQKNIGPAGLTVVIVRGDLIGHAAKNMPSIFDYQVQAKSGSMSNTPPTYAWYIAGLVFAWLKAMGGLKEIAAINQRKAQKLYDCIDGSGGFYRNPVDKACRSRMNIPFILRDEGLDNEFLQQAATTGLMHLKGHRSVGGMRASIYNAMPEEGVDALVQFMNKFMQLKG
ncbi:MAG TPA: 3-phosphoserine/phosphohydroxythreonine transaminase [Acidiferrobacteraceae bacterium]|nr:3-phosphoserine/phosphohydroxythreonine transaminase [Acidiferrobacteraceae bacterium]